MLRKIDNKVLPKVLFDQFQIKNNHTFLNFPTVEECAAFALDAYNTTHDNDAPPGWICVLRSGPNLANYFGKCYIKNWNTDASMIMFAHRGTEFTSPTNIWGDFKIAREKSPAQFDEAWNFIQHCFKFLKMIRPTQDDPDQYYYPYTCTCTNVGHSLGGAIAQAITSLSGGENPLVYSVTFENPGTRGPIIDFLRKFYPVDPISLEKIITSALNWMDRNALVFQRGVNVINSCNEQVGRCFRIEGIPVNYNKTLNMLPYPPSVNFSLNSFYIVDNTSDQHRMQPIVTSILSERFKYHEIKNPIGFQGGYIEYLNPANTTYWNDYFAAIWMEDSIVGASLRAKYHNDQKKFLEDAYIEANNVYEEASIYFACDVEKPIVTPISMFKPVDQIIQEFHLLEIEKQKEQENNCLIM